eukprot:m.270933 g.270933  ORF g.270933 m.270933 type:complete len:103 (+) comp26862_c5_seq6:2239-2547(+)
MDKLMMTIMNKHTSTAQLDEMGALIQTELENRGAYVEYEVTATSELGEGYNLTLKKVDGDGDMVTSYVRFDLIGKDVHALQHYKLKFFGGKEDSGVADFYLA